MKLSAIPIVCGLGLFLVACGPSGRETKVKENKDSGPKNGIYRSHAKNGSLISEVTYVNGLKHGLAKTYYEKTSADKEDRLKLEMNYVQGKREGVSRKYYKDGTLYAVTPYSQDRISGIRKTYYRSGQPKAEIPYFQNRPCAGLIEYRMDGRKKALPKLRLGSSGNDDGTTTVRLRVDKACHKLIFFHGKLAEDKCLDMAKLTVIAMSGSNGIVTGYFNAENNVFACKCTTKAGNPLVLTARLKPT